jgi:hypothetical protein
MVGERIEIDIFDDDHLEISWLRLTHNRHPTLFWCGQPRTIEISMRRYIMNKAFVIIGLGLALSGVASSIAYYGAYSIDEKTKVMLVNLSASTYANVAAIPNQKKHLEVC